MTLIRHLVDGRESAARARTGSRLRPRHRRGRSATVAFATDERGRRGASPRHPLPFPAGARRVSSSAPTCSSACVSCSSSGRTSSPRSSRASTARCSPTPRARSAAGIENVEFAAGLVHLLKGERSEQVSRGVDVHSVKQPVGVVGGDHAVQLPDHGAAVDDGIRASPAATRSCSSPARRTRAPRSSSRSCSRRRGSPPACSTSCTATRTPSTPSSTPPTCGRSASSARPPSPARSTSAPPRAASACRRWAGRRTTWS